MSTATRYKHVRSEVDQVCKELGRDPEEVLLLAVSKTVDVDQSCTGIYAVFNKFLYNA